MPTLQHSRFPICVLVALTVASPVAAQDQPSSLWDLNDSVLGLYKNGAERIFSYQEPREALQQEGVTAGTVWFQGTLTGNTYTGTAFVFQRRCGPSPFHVEGKLDADERRISFTGEQPVSFDAHCKVVEAEDVEFEITFLRSLAPPPPLVYGSIDRAPVPTPPVAQEQARLDAILAEKDLEQQRLRALRAENDRNERALRDQREDAERIARERRKEEQLLAETRAFSGQRSACRKFDIAACGTALRSPHATAQDAIDLQSWRGVALKFRTDLDGCRNGSLSACDAAMASPAIADGQRHQLKEWRAPASPYNRAVVWFSGYAGIVATTTADVVTTIRNLPTSTHVTGGLAAVLTLALAGMAIRSRRTQPSGHPAAPEAPQGATSGKPAPQPPPAAPGPSQSERVSNSSASSTADPDPAPPINQAPARAAPEMVRDTPGAIAALELARAYIEEVRAADTPGLEDHDVRKHHLNTLALASKQLDAAQKLDPDAILEGEDEKEIPYRYSINELKAEALLLEGITHQTYDLKRAIPALRKATTLNPNSARAFYVLGLTHAANMNKTDAVAAFERAVALDPKNLAYRKELNRAESISVGVIAAYKATRAGERVFDAGVKTANVGIFIYNIGVYTWNVFAFTWNVLTFPFRLVLKIFGVFDRILGVK